MSSINRAGTPGGLTATEDAWTRDASAYTQAEQRLLREAAALHQAVCMSTIAATQQNDVKFKSLTLRLDTAIGRGYVGGDVLRIIRSYISNISVLAHAATESCSIAEQTKENLFNEVQKLFGKERPWQSLPGAQEYDGVNYLPWKSWFLNHISYPYPSATEIQALIPLVPGMNKAKFQTWMTNNRRRTGWVDLFKQHAGNDKARMRELFDSYDDPIAGLTMNETVRKAVAKVKNYFAEIQKYKTVDPELEKIISKYDITPVKRSKATSIGSAGPAIDTSPSPPRSEPTTPDSSADSISFRSSSGSYCDAVSPEFTFASPVPSSSGVARTPARKQTKERIAYSVQDSPTNRKQARKPSLYQRPNRPAAQTVTEEFTHSPQEPGCLDESVGGTSTSSQAFDYTQTASGDISVPTLAPIDYSSFSTTPPTWSSNVFAPLDFSIGTTSLAELVNPSNAATPYMGSANVPASRVYR